jgi:putative transposase
MENHYHLLIDTPDGNLSMGMRQLNGVYTQRFNMRHGRVGHLFQGRFKAVLVQKDSHFLEACRYVILNPVRAKMVERPEQWVWSSYGPTAGWRKPPACLMADWVLSQFGSERRKAEAAYRKFVKDGIRVKSIWRDIRAQSVFGEGDFINTLTDFVKGRKQILEIPKSQRFVNRPDLRDVLRENVPRDKRKRNERVFEAVQEHGYTQREVADHLGMHFSSVSRIFREKEKKLKK